MPPLPYEINDADSHFHEPVDEISMLFEELSEAVCSSPEGTCVAVSRETTSGFSGTR